jgi:hypothetical protein
MYLYSLQIKGDSKKKKKKLVMNVSTEAEGIVEDTEGIVERRGHC